MNDTQRRLLDAVDTVIAKHGASGVTVRRVGTEAGLSHTAAAHYYGDKRGLFTAYITRAWHQVGQGAEEAAANDDWMTALRELGAMYAQYALDQPSAFSVMSRMELVNVDSPELWIARERGFFTLFAVLEKAQATGWAADRDTLDLVGTTWAFVHGFVELWVGGVMAAPYDGQGDLPTVLGRLLDPLLAGLDHQPDGDS